MEHYIKQMGSFQSLSLLTWVIVLRGKLINKDSFLIVVFYNGTVKLLIFKSLYSNKL